MEDVILGFYFHGRGRPGCDRRGPFLTPVEHLSEDCCDCHLGPLRKPALALMKTTVRTMATAVTTNVWTTTLQVLFTELPNNSARQAGKQLPTHRCSGPGGMGQRAHVPLGVCF